MFAAGKLLLTPRIIVPSGASFDAAGTGASSTTSPNTFTNIVPADATISLIWVENVSSVINPTISAKIGTTNAIAAGSPLFTATGSGQFVYLTCFSVVSPPTGSQTISFSTTTPIATVINVVHYKGVTSVGTPILATASVTTTNTVSATSTNASYIYAHAATAFTGGAFSGYTQTQRSSIPINIGYPLIMGDAMGNGSTLTFTVTNPNVACAGMIVPLIP